MTKTFYIARKELWSLFVSPIAWVALVAFLVYMAVYYTAGVERVIRFHFSGVEVGFSRTIFTQTYESVFPKAYESLILIVPLLTMGVISRERQNGTMKLIASSPITTAQIIVGKFMAVCAFVCLLVLTIALFVLHAAFFIEELNVGHILAGLFGFFMLALAYAAIGFFMSALTSHQIVAAVSTVALLYSLSFIGAVGQRIPVLSDVIYWFSIEGRARFMLDGLIASKDVIYFLLITGMFLVFTRFVLTDRDGVRSIGTGLRYLSVVSAVAIVGFMTSVPAVTHYLDLHATKGNSLSLGSRQALSEVDGRLKVTVFVNVLDIRATDFLPEKHNRLYRRLFEKHERHIGRLDVSYQFYYARSENDALYAANPGLTDRELADAFARQHRLKASEIRPASEFEPVVDLEAENFRNVYLLEWGGRATVLRNFDDNSYFPGERTLSAAIRRVVEVPVVVGYATGLGGRSPHDLGGENHHFWVANKSFRFSLINNGFDVVEVDLETDFPEYLDILVLPAPKRFLERRSLERVAQFLRGGGNALILAEPGTERVINPIVADWGISLVPGMVADETEGFPESLVFAQVSVAAQRIGIELLPAFGGWPVVLPGAARLATDSIDGTKSTVVLTAGGGLLEEPDASDAVAVAVQRSKNGEEQRLFVIGDADFMSSYMAGLPEPADRANDEFVGHIFAYLSDGRYPIDVSRPRSKDTAINLDRRGLEISRLLYIVAIPLFLMGLGSAIMFVRQRR